MMRQFALFGFAAVTGLMFTGCGEDYGYYDDRPGYYASDGGYGDDADFYYVSSRPYSRVYGELYLRDGSYYYSRGGRYVVYDRPTHVYRNTNYHVVNRDVNVHNVRYNDQRVVRNYDRSDYNRAHYNTTRNNSAYQYQQRHVATPAQQVSVSNTGRHGTNVKVVETKKEKKQKKHGGS
jgi:hypothetical protein